MKKFLVICSCLVVFLVSGCNGTTNVSYTRDTSAGEIIPITYEEYEAMKKTDDTYMVLITQTNCGYCKTYKKEVLDEYLPKHGLTIYELNLTNETDPSGVFAKLKAELEGFEGTPTTLIFEKGKLVEMVTGVIESDQLDEYVVDYQLDKK